MQRKEAKALNQGDTSSTPSSSSFTFLDVGCNEGDLTIALTSHFLTGLRGDTNQPALDTIESDAGSSSFTFTPSTVSQHRRGAISLCAVGIDIDPILTQRAQPKISRAVEQFRREEKNHATSTSTSVQIHIETCDIMEDGAIEEVKRMVRQATPGESSVSSSSPPSISSQPVYPFDLICCYSITMWIHLNHGDSGLRRFLTILASLTTNLLIEPQPWQCYKNARERWRRSGKDDPPHMKELKWRDKVEEEIRRFIEEDCGMVLRTTLGTTKWKRQLLWFQRK